jgi:glucose/mannose-6-phosphate isomerase
VSDLSRAAVDAADPGKMVDYVLAQPGQLADAVWRADSAGFPEPGAGVVVAGMGGSAIGGNLAAAASGRPIRTVRGYEVDSVGDELVLCASYSGDTEETLAAFEAAGAAGARRAVVTTGGALGEAARADGVPVMGVPAGFQPRAAVVYMTVAALAAAGAAGDEIEGAAPLLGRLAEEWGPTAPEDSPAKELARAIQGSIPVVVGAGRTVAAARRWKTQINENAASPAFWSELPEADHNEICGYERPLSLVLLDDPGIDERLRERIDLTARSVDVEVQRVEARGETAFERVMSLVLLGDLVSVYMAVLAGKDPTPVPAIDRLKAELG